LKSIVHASVCSALALVLASPRPPAQVNTKLLAHVDKFPGAVAPTNNYAGIWGYVNPANGREYAIVPARTGTVVYDVTDPANPIERGFIPGPGAASQPYVWREAASFGTWLYLSSEHGSFQVLDMSNPDAPVLAGTFGGNAHTLSVDQGAGTLWANGGAARGSRIYNLHSSPVNPALIATFGTDYVHDCHPAGGFCYVAHINSGNFRIVNTSALPTLTTVSITPTPGTFTHNVWASDNGGLVVTSDENNGGCMTVFDITNKAAPVQKSTWCSPTGATVHNVYLRGKVAHFSNYTDGYRAVDLSAPANPRPIAHYDTTPRTGSDYSGSWGCYPFLPSGVILASDMQRGLFIIENTCGVPVLYGRGTAGTGGFVPAIDYDGGFAQVGNATFGIEGTKLLGGAGAVLTVGFGPGSTHALGIEFLLSLTRPILAFAATADGQPGVGGAGKATVPFPIPADVNLAGLTLYAQFLVLDKSLAASRGMRVAICR
jgi:choice-of-anchor B domain-containing protein